MKGYEEIRKGLAFDGDIVKFTASVYDAGIKARNYQKRFVKRVLFGQIAKINNNGTAYVRCAHGRGHWLSLNTDENIIAVYRRS
jgi:hypothetical protein